MKITALCKTFKGNEFIEAMIRSIYNYVDNIVFVNSELAWKHDLLEKKNSSGNTCKLEILKVKNLIDNKDKIISLDYDTTSQFEQCMYGFEYIKSRLDSDFVMLIDTDEVWDNYNISQAVNFLYNHNDPSYIYRSRLYTYIKQVNYRVEPEEAMCPTVFVSTTRKDLGKNHRGCHLEPRVKMTDEKGGFIYFHHFVYVRRKLETVLEKIKSSNGYEGNRVVDLKKWVDGVWNRMPGPFEGEWAQGIHPALQFKKHWKGIKQIGLGNLPEVFRQYPLLIERFL